MTDTDENHEVEPRMVLHFQLCNQDYGVALDCVREILMWEDLTQISGMPPEAIGVLNLRGRLVPILDLRSDLGLSDEHSPTRIVVLEQDGVSIGVGVSSVHSVYPMDIDGIQRAPFQEATSTVTGMLETQIGLIQLVNLEKYFQLQSDVPQTAQNAPDEASSDELDKLYLTLGVGGQAMAVSVASVREIVRHSGHTSVPLSPASVSGVLNLRGTILPVLNLGRRLGVKQRGNYDHVIVMEVHWDDGHHLIGLLVEDVHQVISIDLKALQPTPSYGLAINNRFVTGISHAGVAPVAILELEQVLNLKELCDVGGGP